MKVQFRIALACGFGALIGTLIASYVGYGFSWVGLGAAGIFGYLAYDFRQVATVSERSARQVAAEISDSAGEWLERGWKGFGAGLRVLLLGLNFTLIPLVISYALLHLSLIPEDLTRLDSGFVDHMTYGLSLVLALACVAGVLISGILPVFAFLSYVFSDNFRNQFDADWNTSTLLRTGLRWNLLTLVGYWSWYGPYVAFTSIPYRLVVRSIRQFLSLVFVGIHSDMRLLCACYALLGATIGYYGFDNAIIGFFAGALLGLAQYELISKRFLKAEVTAS